jgi:hypothetical protein
MRRALSIAIICSLLVLLAVDIRASSDGPAKDSSPNEVPRSWDIKEIEKAAPPFGDVDGARIFVLAWQVREDDRPLRVESCLVLKDLGRESEAGRWCLSHLYRHPLGKQKTWQLAPIWVSPPPPLGPEKPVVINHFKRLKNKPTNKEIYGTTKEIQWKFSLDEGWNWVSCSVCEKSWEAAIGEKPTRYFGN